MKCYRFVTADLKSQSGNVQWVVGEWVKHAGKLTLCNSGLHACKTPRESLEYVYGDRWFIAEYRGKVVEGDDKLCASGMRLVKEIPLSVIQHYAVDCAEHVLHIYEKQYPDDLRVRDCIEAVKAFLDDPTDENRVKISKSGSAAESTAWSAAGSAAWSAAWSAWSAWSARSAVGSAWSAAWSARSAAGSAEEAWQNSHLTELIEEATQ